MSKFFRFLALIALGLLLLGCVSTPSTAPPSGVPPPDRIPTKEERAASKCVLTNYEHIVPGETKCELLWGYPSYKPVAAACANLEAPDIPSDIAGPPGTGNLVECTDEGLAHKDCCDSLKIVWPDWTCSAGRLYCLGSHGPAQQKRLSGHSARCATCEDMCPPSFGTCTNGVCYAKNQPGNSTQRVDCKTLKPK